MCCEERAYDSELQICCNGEVVEREEFHQMHLQKLKEFLEAMGVDFAAYLENHGIAPKSLMTCLECCRDKVYFKNDDKICCEGELHKPRPANAECCGQKAIDSVKLICCDGNAQSRPDNAACCGRVAYDRLKMYCCSRELIELQSDHIPGTFPNPTSGKSDSQIRAAIARARSIK